MDWFETVALLIGSAVVGLAGWHLDRQARLGSQVLAVALGSKELFVLHRGHVYLVGSMIAGWLLPGRMLSREDRRAIFDSKGGAPEAECLTGHPGSSFKLLAGDPPAAAILRMERGDGTARSWSFSSRSDAKDLYARLSGAAAQVVSTPR